MAKVTAKGIRLRAIAEQLERQAAELRRLADLEDNVARVTLSASKAKPKKKAKAKKAKKLVAKKVRRPKAKLRRPAKASTRATVRAAQRAVGRGGR